VKDIIREHYRDYVDDQYFPIELEDYIGKINILYKYEFQWLRIFMGKLTHLKISLCIT